MDSLLIAIDVDGQKVIVDPKSVIALTPNENSFSTTLFLDGKNVVVDIEYETLIERFSSAWS